MASQKTKKRWRRLSAPLVGALAIALACGLAPLSVAVAEAVAPDGTAETEQLIIVYENELCEADAEVIASQEEIIAADGSTGAIAVATVAEGVDLEEALEALADDPNVASVQPNYTYQLLETDDDGTADEDADGSDAEEESASSSVSYLELAGFTTAWDMLAGCELSSVTVAVIDTGCNLLHEELVDVLDADLAYDAVSGVALGSAGVANNGDSNGHGTMVCGVVAAAGGGLVDVLPICIFGDDDTATTADILAAYAYLEDLIESGQLTDLCAINLSIGYYTDDSTMESDAALETAIEAMLEEHGVLTVCAGGNSSSSSTLYPADFDACVSVVSVDSAGSISSFSDYNYLKDLFAYGEDVVSTSADGGSSTLTGTSMAAPQVAAAAALIWAANPDLSAAQVVAILQATATEVADADEGTPGILNIAAAVQEALATSSESDEADEAQTGGVEATIAAASESSSESDGTAAMTLLEESQETLAETGDTSGVTAAVCALAGLLLLVSAIINRKRPC